MRLVRPIASTAALLLSSSVLFAQQTPMNFENVFVDVDGTAVRIPIALAAEACGLDAAGIQQAALTRVQESGLDEATVQELLAASDITDPAAGDAMDAGAETSTDTAAADAASTPAPGSEPASPGDTDIAAAETPAPGGEPASADTAEGTTDMAAAESGQDMTGVIEGAETTAAETDTTTNAQGTADPTTSAPGQDNLALAVCQVDVTRAAELGIPTVTNETVTD
jgi:hypothetical protein